MTAATAALVDQIDAALPQTQCTRCGYPCCRAYAEAVARGKADINRCPPGGATTIRRIARILDVAAKPLDPTCGAPKARLRARIDEARCIGCRKCADVCPVDAIVGARGFMHTVIAAECSGCELCLTPCPVDCIELAAAQPPAPGRIWTDYDDREVANWRARTEARRARCSRPATGRSSRQARDRRDIAEAPAPAEIRREIAAAVARVKARRDAESRGN